MICRGMKEFNNVRGMHTVDCFRIRNGVKYAAGLLFWSHGGDNMLCRLVFLVGGNPGVLRPGNVGMQGSAVFRLCPPMTMNTSSPLPVMSMLLCKRNKGRTTCQSPPHKHSVLGSTGMHDNEYPSPPPDPSTSTPCNMTDAPPDSMRVAQGERCRH